MAKVLIVDDEDDIREFATGFFRRRKVEVITASSGEEALDAIQKKAPDLILLDIKLPGIDGIETLQRIREKNKDVKIVMVTGREPEEGGAWNKCSQMGAIAYIHKPLQLDELERVVLTELEKISQ